jgi:hypothetical protein
VAVAESATDLVDADIDALHESRQLLDLDVDLGGDRVLVCALEDVSRTLDGDVPPDGEDQVHHVGEEHLTAGLVGHLDRGPGVEGTTRNRSQGASRAVNGVVRSATLSVGSNRRLVDGLVSDHDIGADGRIAQIGGVGRGTEGEVLDDQRLSLEQRHADDGDTKDGRAALALKRSVTNCGGATGQLLEVKLLMVHRDHEAHVATDAAELDRQAQQRPREDGGRDVRPAGIVDIRRVGLAEPAIEQRDEVVTDVLGGRGTGVVEEVALEASMPEKITIDEQLLQVVGGLGAHHANDVVLDRLTLEVDLHVVGRQLPGSHDLLGLKNHLGVRDTTANRCRRRLGRWDRHALADADLVDLHGLGLEAHDSDIAREHRHVDDVIDEALSLLGVELAVRCESGRRNQRLLNQLLRLSQKFLVSHFEILLASQCWRLETPMNRLLAGTFHGDDVGADDVGERRLLGLRAALGGLIGATTPRISSRK